MRECSCAVVAGEWCRMIAFTNSWVVLGKGLRMESVSNVLRARRSLRLSVLLLVAGLFWFVGVCVVGGLWLFPHAMPFVANGLLLLSFACLAFSIIEAIRANRLIAEDAACVRLRSPAFLLLIISIVATGLLLATMT